MTFRTNVRGIFIAGTGTGVGKSLITAGVLRRLQAHAPEAIVMKPMQTGAEPVPGQGLAAPDVDFVLRAADLTVDPETLSHISPYIFATACSPHLAARLAGRPIDIDVILSSARWLAGRYRSLVVEGAGGLCVPLDDKGHTMLDLISALDLPVILVGHAGLGAINHALLSLTALHQNGCRVLGVVLNDTVPIEAEQAYIHDDNALVIARLGRAQVLRVPYLGPQQERASNMAQLDALLDGTHCLKEALQ